MVVQYFTIGPKALPLSPVDELVGDCYIEQLRIVNDGNGASGVAVYDKQSPAICLISNKTTIAPGGQVSETVATDPLTGSNGRPMKGGITWSATQAGVHGWIKGYCLL